MSPASIIGPLESPILVGTQLTPHPGCSLLGLALPAVPRTCGHCHDTVAGCKQRLDTRLSLSNLLTLVDCDCAPLTVTIY